MQTCPAEMTIEGQRYVRADLVEVKGEYVLIRSAQSGVHAGYLKERAGDEVTLLNSRRVHYWKGAASLSEMAMKGIKDHANSRIAVALPCIMVLGVCEIIPCTEAARMNLEGAPGWKVN